MTQTTKQAQTKQPQKLTVPPTAKSAKLSDKELLKLGRVCLMQGAKKLGENSSKEALCDLFCSGIESGYLSSITIEEFIEPKKMTFRTDEKEIYRHLDYPMNTGGALKVFDKYEYNENGNNPETCYRYTLDLDKLIIGLARLSLDYPKIYAQWLDNSADALTGDALIQCALFGSIVYN